MKQLALLLLMAITVGTSDHVVTTVKALSKNSPCSGCALNYFYAVDADSPPSTPPSYLQLGAYWAGSTSGLCTGESVPCTPNPCTLSSAGGLNPNLSIGFGSGSPTFYLPTFGGSVDFGPGDHTRYYPALQQLTCGGRTYETFYSDSACTTPAFVVGFICKDLCPQ